MTSELKEYVISKQLLKSGTSIGANVPLEKGGPLKEECEEIRKILSSIMKTLNS